MPDPVPSIRVLVAEDDQVARELLIDVLAARGYDVVAQVESGREAVTQACALVPDVVLLDVHMPDVGGIAAAREITAALPATAVVLFTGDPSVSLTDEDIAGTQALSLLPKPTPPNTLDSALRLAVARVRTLAQATREARDARDALEARKMIERAKGILMRRTGTSEQEAYRIMQRSSQDRSVPMVDIARAILESEPGAATSRT